LRFDYLYVRGKKIRYSIWFISRMWYYVTFVKLYIAALRYIFFVLLLKHVITSDKTMSTRYVKYNNNQRAKNKRGKKY